MQISFLPFSTSDMKLGHKRPISFLSAPAQNNPTWILIREAFSRSYGVYNLILTSDTKRGGTSAAARSSRAHQESPAVRCDGADLRFRRQTDKTSEWLL